MQMQGIIRNRVQTPIRRIYLLTWIVRIGLLQAEINRRIKFSIINSGFGLLQGKNFSYLLIDYSAIQF